MTRNLLFWTTLAFLSLPLGCSREFESPITPSSPSVPSASFSKPGEEPSSLDLIEEDVSSGLLDRNNACVYREYAVSDPGKLPAKYRSQVIGKDATYSMVQIAREWDQLSASARKEITEVRANGMGNLKETVTTDHFVLHYTTQGNSAVPALDNSGNGVPDFIDIAAQSLETVWQREVGQLGYPAPKGTPQQKFHIYFKEMPYYGYTVPENVELTALSPVPLGTASAWIAVENDFAGFPRNDEDVTGLEVIRSGALKVTQAHEFMHAIQFNINVYQSGWLMESHATWAEDAVYDGVNDWHWYLRSFLATPDHPIFNRYAYGSAFFMNYLSESYGVDLPRRIWEAARYSSTPDAVRMVAFDGSWEAMKAFAPAEYTLDLSDFTTDGPSVVPNPSNLIRGIYDTYPVSVQVQPSTKKTANRAPWGLGANFIEFLPAGESSITVSFDGTDGYAWRVFLVGIPKSGNADPSTWEVSLDGSSAGEMTLSGLGTRWAKVALVCTIADRPGREVPFSFGATLGTGH